MNNKALWPEWENGKLIGRGSYGSVYEIERTLFAGYTEKAALKIISVPHSDSELDELRDDHVDEESITLSFKSRMETILNEYRLMREMKNCPNIVLCDDVRCVQQANGVGWDIFIKMELLTPLRKSLPEKIPEEAVQKLALDICTALEYCKEQGIVHRDIKPANIFVSQRGDYKLGDFGIAKTMEATSGATAIGTLSYMAPEVCFGQPYGRAADIYSLGMVLYWMLNERRLPFLPLSGRATADREETARRRRLSGEPLPPPAHGSRALKRIVLKACAFSAGDRYKSPTEMKQALLTLGDPLPAKTASPTDTEPEAKEATGILTPEEEATGILTPEEEEATGILTPEEEEETCIPDIYSEGTGAAAAPTPPKPAAPKPAPASIAASYWWCSCGYNNTGLSSTCSNCGRKMPASARKKPTQPPVKAASPSDWTCSCGTKNPSFRNYCSVCLKENPEAVQAAARRRYEQKAAEERKRKEAELLRKKKAEAGQPQHRQFAADWWCSCGTKNSGFRTYCSVCLKEKPKAAGASLRPSAVLPDKKDWWCPCGCKNYGGTYCSSCGMDRAEALRRKK